jgi:hypothetical protein
VPNEIKEVTTYRIDLCSYFKKEIDNVKLTKDRKELIYEDRFEELEKFGQKGEILRYVDTHTPHYLLVRLIKTLKLLKCNAIYYNEKGK